MAIQMRRGNQASFNPNLLMPGEFAVSQDEAHIYICITAGQVIEIATTSTVDEVVREIQQALEDAESYANYSKSYAVGTNGVTRAGDTTDNSKYYKEQAETLYSQILAVISGVTPAFSIDFTDGHIYYQIGT